MSNNINIQEFLTNLSNEDFNKYVLPEVYRRTHLEEVEKKD